MNTSSQEASGSGPPTHLEQELREQPQALQRLLDAEIKGAQMMGQRLRTSGVNWVLIIARGSSDNAARYAQYLFGVHHELPVALAAPSILTVYGKEPRLDGALVIAVSQSGRSPDSIAVLESARRQGRPTLAITNDPSSPLAEAASEVMALHAGPERSVAATKTYLNSLCALALLSASLEEPATQAERVRELQALPAAVHDTIEAVLDDRDALSLLTPAQHCAVVGRGFNYGTAFEIALKLKELTGMIAEPYSPADLQHGPIAAISEGFPVALVAPKEPSIASIRELVPSLQERKATLLVVSADQDLLDVADAVLPLSSQPAPHLTPLIAVLPGQVLAWRLAEARGWHPDHPPGLQKVTRTY